MASIFCRLQRHSLVLLGIFTVTALSVPSPARLPQSRGKAPEWRTGPWINSPPLSLEGLKGKVVVLEFWTYG
jgi:hypothetical protein